MSKEKHGLIGTVIKAIMVTLFTALGAALITLGSIYIAKKWDIEGENFRWLSICNIVFGACLLTSPFFLNKKREGLNKIIKILMVIVFALIGIALITGGAIALARHYTDYKALSICNVVFGSLLLTSPYFLKK